MVEGESSTRFDAYRSHRYVSIPWALAIPAFIAFAITAFALDHVIAVPIVTTLSLLGVWLRQANLRVRLDVGADGIHYASRFEKRFVKWSEVEQIDHDARGVRLRLRGRRPLAFSVALGELSSLDLVEAQKRLLMCIRRAYGLAEPDANAGLSAHIMRRGRPTSEWLASLSSGPSFRSASVREEDLWTIVEDPSAAPTARAGAAVVLAREAKKDERERLRVAAEACAEPRLRVVLGRAAKGEDATDSLDEIEDDPASRSTTA